VSYLNFRFSLNFFGLNPIRGINTNLFFFPTSISLSPSPSLILLPSGNLQTILKPVVSAEKAWLLLEEKVSSTWIQEKVTSFHFAVSFHTNNSLSIQHIYKLNRFHAATTLLKMHLYDGMQTTTALSLTASSGTRSSTWE
jgi:hypothetical protein